MSKYVFFIQIPNNYLLTCDSHTLKVAIKKTTENKDQLKLIEDCYDEEHETNYDPSEMVAFNTKYITYKEETYRLNAQEVVQKTSRSEQAKLDVFEEEAQEQDSLEQDSLDKDEQRGIDPLEELTNNIENTVKKVERKARKSLPKTSTRIIFQDKDGNVIQPEEGMKNLLQEEGEIKDPVTNLTPKKTPVYEPASYSLLLPIFSIKKLLKNFDLEEETESFYEITEEREKQRLENKVKEIRKNLSLLPEIFHKKYSKEKKKLKKLQSNLPKVIEAYTKLDTLTQKIEQDPENFRSTSNIFKLRAEAKKVIEKCYSKKLRRQENMNEYINTIEGYVKEIVDIS